MNPPVKLLATFCHRLIVKRIGNFSHHNILYGKQNIIATSEGDKTLYLFTSKYSK